MAGRGLCLWCVCVCVCGAGGQGVEVMGGSLCEMDATTGRGGQGAQSLPGFRGREVEASGPVPALESSLPFRGDSARTERGNGVAVLCIALSIIFLMSLLGDLALPAEKAK